MKQARHIAQINLQGIGLGNGWFAPEHSARYANFLFEVCFTLFIQINCEPHFFHL
jgi:hypothetical protein